MIHHFRMAPKIVAFKCLDDFQYSKRSKTSISPSQKLGPHGAFIIEGEIKTKDLLGELLQGKELLRWTIPSISCLWSTTPVHLQEVPQQTGQTGHGSSCQISWYLVVSLTIPMLQIPTEPKGACLTVFLTLRKKVSDTFLHYSWSSYSLPGRDAPM